MHGKTIYVLTVILDTIEAIQTMVLNVFIATNITLTSNVLNLEVMCVGVANEASTC